MHLGKPISELTDAELILAYKNSQQKEMVGELFKRYTGLVFGVCLKYLKDRELAKDAVMQLFEKLLSTLLTHEVAHFKSWLYVSARNHCLMQLRSAKGKIHTEISPFLMENREEEHQTDGIELETNLSKLEKCIDTLNTEQKKCVQLFYLQERCYQEVAEHTGYDMGKVKSYIQNGKRNLKICMENNE